MTSAHMLKPHGHYGQVYVEITRGASDRGGPGWNFGTSLWIPTRTAKGADRYGLMRQVQPGNLVLHVSAKDWEGTGVMRSRLCGASIVASKATETPHEPPLAGAWGGHPPYYRVELLEYLPFARAIETISIGQMYLAEIRHDLLSNDPKFYPFATYGAGIRLVQGIYLARCTTALYELLSVATSIEESARDAEEGRRGHIDYAEGRRILRERYFFTRNQNLIEAAKKNGSRCQVCQFDFGEQFGNVGAGFIEAHHLDPLSESSEIEWTEEIRTRVDQIALLCANCHRMAHRRRPAYSLLELNRVRHPSVPG